MKWFPASILLSAWLIISPPLVLAATVNFTPVENDGYGAVVADIPCEKIGSVKIPRGRVSLDGTDMEITTIPDYMFDREVVLSGTVLKTKAKVDNGEARITGIAYLQEGDWLKYFDNPQAVDTLDTDQGQIVGHITGIADNVIEIDEQGGAHKQVPVDSLKDLFSPRAFKFSIPAHLAQSVTQGQVFEAQADTINVNPSGAPYKLSALKTDIRKQSDHDMSWGQIAAVSTAFGLIELAQLAPFIILPAVSYHYQDIANAKILRTLLAPNIVNLPNQIPPH